MSENKTASIEHSRPGIVELPWCMSAADIVRAVEAHHDADPVNFDEEFSRYNLSSVKKFFAESNGKYYRMLSAYTRLFRPQRVCEVGCYNGSSAMALAKFDTPVDTFDVNLGPICDRKLFTDKGISAFELSRADQCVDIGWHKYDALFLDIGQHEGEYERRIHEKLVGTAWKGVVFWDDIGWEGMRPFWESITNDKAETDWHSSGFGVVTYRGVPQEIVAERSETT